MSKNKIVEKSIGTYTVKSTVIDTAKIKNIPVVAVTDHDENVTVEIAYHDGNMFMCKEVLYDVVFGEDSDPETCKVRNRIKTTLSSKGYLRYDDKAIYAKRLGSTTHKGGFVYLSPVRFVSEMDVIIANINSYAPTVDVNALRGKYKKMTDVLIATLVKFDAHAKYIRERLGMSDKEADRLRRKYLVELKPGDAAETVEDKHHDGVAEVSSCNCRAEAATLSKSDIIEEAVNKKIAIWNGTIDLIDADIAKAKDTISQLCRTKRELQLKVAALNELIENK